MENKPNFWSVMPASVRYDSRLRPNAKILYSEITALSNKSGFCTATNEYFSELYSLSKTTVSQLISELAKYGYIRVDIIRNDNKAIEERRIFCAEEHAPFLYGGISKNKHTSIEKTQEPISKKCKENNTSINNNTPISPKGDSAVSENLPAEKPNVQVERFTVFWQAYPKKVAKGAAERAWRKIKPSAELLQEMLAAIERGKVSKQWNKDNGQYIPNPSTWLNQKRWEDELEPMFVQRTAAPDEIIDDVPSLEDEMQKMWEDDYD